MTRWRHQFYACLTDNFAKNIPPTYPDVLLLDGHIVYTLTTMSFSFMLILIYCCFVCHLIYCMQCNLQIEDFLDCSNQTLPKKLHHFLCNIQKLQLQKEPSLQFLPKLLRKPVPQMLWKDCLGFEEYGQYAGKMLTIVYSDLPEFMMLQLLTWRYVKFQSLGKVTQYNH